MNSAGEFGPEELLINFGSPNKPEPMRLPDGKVLLVYADITRTDAYGYPVEQVLKAVVLSRDAPRP